MTRARDPYTLRARARRLADRTVAGRALTVPQAWAYARAHVRDARELRAHGYAGLARLAVQRARSWARYARHDAVGLG